MGTSRTRRGSRRVLIGCAEPGGTRFSDTASGELGFSAHYKYPPQAPVDDVKVEKILVFLEKLFKVQSSGVREYIFRETEGFLKPGARRNKILRHGERRTVARDFGAFPLIPQKVGKSAVSSENPRLVRELGFSAHPISTLLKLQEWQDTR